MEILSNIAEIKEILSQLYVLTECRAAVFDKNFQELYAYPSRLCGFCKALRENEYLDKQCKNNDLTHFLQCKNARETVVYKCHANFHEIIVPIILDAQIVGYFMAGQIYTENGNDDNLEVIFKKYKNLSLDYEKLSLEYANTKNVSTQKLSAIKKVAEVSAGYIANIYAENMRKESLAEKIDEFIINNLTKDLSVDVLCAYFNYKKTTFYKVTNELFKTSITGHVKEMRILKAKQLLAKTNLRISEVAQEVGIFDYNYFTKVFKSEVNCTPREYRKNNLFEKNVK